MPKVFKIGRTYAIAIAKDIVNGFGIREKDEFILETRPEAGEIVIKLRKRFPSVLGYLKRADKKSIVRDREKKQIERVWIKLTLEDPVDVKDYALNWLPAEVEILKSLLGNKISSFEKRKIKKILRVLRIHKRNNEFTRENNHIAEKGISRRNLFFD